MFYKALSIAVQYGKQAVILKLLQLGADKTIRTKTGKSPADLAEIFKHKQVMSSLPLLTIVYAFRCFIVPLYGKCVFPQIARILASSSELSVVPASNSMEETLSKLFKTNSDDLSSKER